MVLDSSRLIMTLWLQTTSCSQVLVRVWPPWRSSASSPFRSQETVHQGSSPDWYPCHWSSCWRNLQCKCNFFAIVIDCFHCSTSRMFACTTTTKTTSETCSSMRTLNRNQRTSCRVSCLARIRYQDGSRTLKCRWNLILYNVFGTCWKYWTRITDFWR